MRKYRLFLLLILSITACNNDCVKAPKVMPLEDNISIHRFDQDIFKCQSKEALDSLINPHYAFKHNFLMAEELPKNIYYDQLIHLVTDTNLDTLRIEVKEHYADLSDIEQGFEDAFSYLKYYYSDFKIPEIYTVITGFGNEMYIDNDIIVLGLDFYMGDAGSFQPKDYPLYIIQRFKRDFIIPSCINYISQQYNQYNPADKSMLAEIIYYGKSYYMTQQLMPCTPIAEIISYPDSILQDVQESKEFIYAHFIEEKLFYENNPQLKSRYIGERPTVNEISAECPGRIGQWLGYEIVKAYMKNHSDVSLQELMAINDAQKIFKEAGFNPKK